MKLIVTLFSMLIATGQTASAQIRIDSSKRDSLKTYKLNEIAIKNKIQTVQVLTDKVLLNVESMTNVSGLNALELLKQSPGISTDGQDNLKMSGKKGIQIMLDGRLQQLSGQQLASLLKATPANNIKTIELISNPSAKYDAAGNAGIINIILKRPSGEGITANLAAGYQFTAHFRQNASFGLNARKRKLVVFANGSYDNSLQHTIVSSTRITPQKTFAQAGIERQGYSNPNLRTGIEYTASNNSKIGAILSIAHEWEDFPSDANTLVTGTSASNLQTSTLANSSQNRLGANLNYQYDPNGKNSIKAEADLTKYRSKIANNVANLINSATPAGFINDTRSDINLYSIKADHSYNGKKIQLETGFKISASRTANTLIAEQSGTIAAPTAITNFHYKENIYAGYASIAKENEKWSLKGGLRTELTQMQGNVGDLKIPIRDTSYLNLFPTFFLRYKLTTKHSIGFSYTRRLDRPSFSDQNPYTYRTDLYYSIQGNPLLLPQFTTSLSFDLAYNSQLQLKATYSQIQNLIETITTQNADQTLALPINAGKKQLINLSFSTPFNIAKYWSGYLAVEPSYQFYAADLSGYSGLSNLHTKGAGIGGSLSNTFTVSPTLKAGLSGWISYTSRSSIYRSSPIYSIDLSTKKTLFSSKATLSLAYRDLLNTQRVKSRALAGSINQISIRKWESSGLYIGFAYTIGSQKIKNSSSGKGNPEEQNRIKGRN